MTTTRAQKSKYTGKTIALTAMFAALVTAATAFIKIPAPLGYAHAGDAVVYLAACVLPAPFGFIAASLGGGLADLLSGYAVWAVPTALIKALNVLPFFLMRRRLQRARKDSRILHPLTLLMLLPTTAVTVGGYFAANLLLYDRGAAWAETPFNLVQAAVAAVLFIILGAALDAISFKQKLI
ncbi:MAG: ECF transporter S component [Ruminococcus sp.]|nr:ECF transporter S component [Ruminococcus sp.]